MEAPRDIGMVISLLLTLVSCLLCPRLPAKLFKARWN